MLPHSNIFMKDMPQFWSQSTLFAYLNLEKSAANLRKIHRLILKSSYLPEILQPDCITDENKLLLQQNLLQQDITSIHSRRGKWLVLQHWSQTDGPELIMANDGRGARQWLFAENGQNLQNHLATFINALVANSTNPLLLILHGVLAKYRDSISDDEAKKVTRTPYPQYHKQLVNKTMVAKKPMSSLSHLDRLEAESIHIIREVVAETKNPAMLYSIGKDSSVMLHLARKAFWPGRPPFPLLHVDTGWKFRAMYDFRDQVSISTGMELLIHINPDGVAKGINPQDHGSAIHTDIMKTQGLKQALDLHNFDAVFGGARRDEEKSRAKERIFSFRTHTHQWDPKNQRPELWDLYNTRVAEGETMRVFPISNWTELDIWSYIYRENIPIVPLYFAAERPVIERDGTLIMVDDERFKLNRSDNPQMRHVRFRTLGCYPLTGAVESNATTLEDIILELLRARQSERQGRTIDNDSSASMEQKKMEGYF
ncbi:sulfate adenylyltransferase subunit CysD [Alphaproteobacteria bacterium]|nr:sulfate adenylyltransferase subunit CysD [Alphaproteobacteria bacterium]